LANLVILLSGGRRPGADAADARLAAYRAFLSAIVCGRAVLRPARMCLACEKVDAFDTKNIICIK
jgi:hypothetical protein